MRGKYSLHDLHFMRKQDGICRSGDLARMELSLYL